MPVASARDSMLATISASGSHQHLSRMAVGPMFTLVSLPSSSRVSPVPSCAPGHLCPLPSHSCLLASGSYVWLASAGEGAQWHQVPLLRTRVCEDFPSVPK